MLPIFVSMIDFKRKREYAPADYEAAYHIVQNAANIGDGFDATVENLRAFRKYLSVLSKKCGICFASRVTGKNTVFVSRIQ